MEIENNLISFSDVSSISEIKSLNQKLLSLYIPYKQILNVVNTQEDISTGHLYNMITNRQLTLTQDQAIELFESMDGYLAEATPKDGKDKVFQLFSPIVEIPQFWSAPKFIIRIPKVVKTYGSSKYELLVDLGLNKDNTCQTMVARFFKILSKLTLSDSGTMTVAFFHRPWNQTDLDIKVQFMDILLSPVATQKYLESIKEYLVKSFGKTHPGMTFHREMYNELYVTNSNPRKKKWKLEKIIGANMGSAGDERYSVNIDEFLKKIQPSSCPFTINDYGVESYRKVKNTTKYDSEEVPSNIVVDTKKLQLLSVNHYARYYSLVLDNLPNKYQNVYEEWKSVILAFKEKREYRALLEDFSKTTRFYPEEFGMVWNSTMTKIVDHGFLYQECLKQTGFKELVSRFYKSHMEICLYETCCKITTMICADVIAMMYNGLFYMVSDGRVETWWRFIDKHQTNKIGEIYKWRKINGSPLFLKTLIQEEFKPMFDAVKLKLELDIKGHSNYKTLNTNLTNSTIKFQEPAIYNKIIDMLAPKVNKYNFDDLKDSYRDVIGTENGILYLDLASPDPKPQLIQGYSQFIITKWVNANYIEYDPENTYVQLWRKIYSDIFIENDVCQFFWYMLSTGLDQMCKVWKILQIGGPDGSNGKSVALDNPSYVLKDYATKLRPELLIAKNNGGADENLMDMKGKNLGIITETNENDELVSSRIKEITEFEKRGRGLYAKNESFQTNITIFLASNHPLVIDEDGGVERRLLYVTAKSTFKENPDPANPREKKVNRTYENLAMENKDAADALLSILVYERCQLQRLYGSNLDRVPCPTIMEETQNYKVSQNRFSLFLCTKLVIIYGYLPNGERNPNISDNMISDYYLERCITVPEKLINIQIANAFISWIKKYTEKTWTLDKAQNKMSKSKLYKFYKNGDELHGFRILGETEKKLDNEYYFTI